MNEHDKAELERLKIRQQALLMQLSTLGADIERLSSRLSEAAQPVQKAVTEEAVPSEIPPLRLGEEPSPLGEPVMEQQSVPAPPPLPPVIAHAPVGESPPPPIVVAEEPIAFVPPIPPPAPAPRETFEMKLGTYWLVRVGIVMLLTGLVFLGNYAYKTLITKFGHAEKVVLLYAASAALLGFGGWLQRRREKESVRNYGQVLFAGGLAAVYFTTYAAHHFEVLRIIASPVIDGLLLLGWGAVTVSMADRRKSEVLALFAVGLSYYTSSITDVGFFTLYSNLILTAAAVFFLVRNRWTTLSFISVLATYGGFAFWRFHHGDWAWDARTAEVWNANFFLAGYWLLFTAAVFFSRGSALVNKNRAIFASLNNTAFFGLVLLSMIHISRGHFWQFSLGFGAALLVAALLARRFIVNEPAIKNTYLVQGLTLVTVGLIAHYAGLKLALILATESFILTVLGHQQRNPFIRGGGYITAALSAAWVLIGMTSARADIALGAVIGTSFLFNAWWEQRADEKRTSAVLHPLISYFVILAVWVYGVATWRAVPENWRAVAWMVEALALTAAFYALRIPELPVFSQGLAVAAQGLWFFQFALQQGRPHWTVPAALVVGTLALSHWWQRQKPIAIRADMRNILQIIYGLALVGVIFFWLQPEFAPAAWLAFLSALAVGLTIYGVATRAWALAACAQVFLLISSIEFFQQFLGGKPPWEFALVPIASWLGVSIATTAYLSRHAVGVRESVSRPLLAVSTFYRGVAFFMSLWWVFKYVPTQNQFWVFCLISFGLIGIAGVAKNRETLTFGGLFLVVALGSWFSKVVVDATAVRWPNAVAMIGILAAQQLTRRLPGRYNLPQHVGSATVLITGVAIGTFVSHWVVLTSGAHFLLTVSWAGLAAALFALGFALHERMHRWLGLGMLACAVGRVFMSDVWKLDTLYRILSFLALGIVLLALGFIYNKYQEKIRQWL